MEVYDFQNGRHDVIRRVLLENAYFPKTGPILTKLSELEHMGVPSDLTLLSFTSKIQDGRHDIIIAICQNGRICMKFDTHGPQDEQTHLMLF